MSVKERKINLLLSLFSEKEVLTVEEIKDKLNINDRSVKNYIGYLRDYGIEVVPMNKKYRMVSDKPLGMGLFSSQEFRMVKIILTVGDNNGRFTKKELADEIIESLCDDDSISRKTIERAIRVCEENKYICLDENSRYRVCLETDTFTLTSDEDVFKFMELCSIYKSHIPFYNEINKLKAKIIEQTGYEDTDCSVYCIGRGYSCDDSLRCTIKQFEAFDYRNKALCLGYDSKKGYMKVTIQTVTLLYNWENDRSYIIGIVDGEIYFIDIKTIREISETENINKLYNDKCLMEKIGMMFGASLDGPYDVKVEFENIFNIREKLVRLSNHRKSCKISVSSDKIIYTDTIYGIYDFARYLRGFGSSCKVIGPQKLKDIMRETYEKILETYGVMENE